MAVRMSINREQIEQFCRRHHIRELAFFGSVLRDDFGPESDVDVLVEFEPGHVPGLAFFSMEEELSGILGRKVDLNTRGFLSPDLRGRVLSEVEFFVSAPLGENPVRPTLKELLLAEAPRAEIPVPSRRRWRRGEPSLL